MTDQEWAVEAKKHTEYTRGILDRSAPNRMVTVECAMYLYEQALLHGWKHARAEMCASAMRDIDLTQEDNQSCVSEIDIKTCREPESTNSAEVSYAMMHGEPQSFRGVWFRSSEYRPPMDDTGLQSELVLCRSCKFDPPFVGYYDAIYGWRASNVCVDEPVYTVKYWMPLKELNTHVAGQGD